MRRIVQCAVGARGRRQLSNVAGGVRSVPNSGGLTAIGSILSITAAGGPSKLHLYIDKCHKKYGPIFRQRLGPVSGVFVSDADYMRKVFAVEGKYPRHVVPESWKVYNEKHSNERGLFFMDGEEWASLRKPMNKVMLKGTDDEFRKASSIVAKRMVEKFREEETVTDLEHNLYKWSLEVIVAVLMGSEAFAQCRSEITEEMETLAHTVHQVFVKTAPLSLVSARLAMRFRLPVWKRFAAVVGSTIESGKNLFKLLMDLKEKHPRSDGLLRKIQHSGVRQEYLERIVLDLILAAGDTTSYTMQWILHLLSINRDIQNLICQELVGLEEENAVSCPILKGVLKESLRLYPVAPFITRYMPEDVNIDGYSVKSGELILMSLYTSGRDERYFEDPQSFSPHRWVRSSNRFNSQMNINASLPFAIGSRSCIGKKIAETQIIVTLFHILKNFELITTHDRPIDITLRMISVPERPISLILKPRTSENYE